MPYSAFYVPIVSQTHRQGNTEGNSEFRECFKPMGDANRCIRYEVQCQYCTHHGKLTDCMPYRSICHKTNWKLKHVGRRFVVCDYYEPNMACRKKCSADIDANRITTGGYVRLTIR